MITELENSDIIKFDEIKCEIQKSIYWADRLAELDKKNKKILLKNLKKEYGIRLVLIDFYFKEKNSKWLNFLAP